MEDGLSRFELAKKFKLNTSEITLYHHLYLMGGSQRVVEYINKPRAYGTKELKQRVVRYIEKTNIPLADAAIKFNLALGTVSRWCTQAQKYGIESLKSPNYHVHHRRKDNPLDFMKWHSPELDEQYESLDCITENTEPMKKQVPANNQSVDSETLEQMQLKIKALELDVQRLKAENAIRKKAKALVEERMHQMLKQKNGQKSSLD